MDRPAGEMQEASGYLPKAAGPLSPEVQLAFLPLFPQVLHCLCFPEDVHFSIYKYMLFSNPSFPIVCLFTLLRITGCKHKSLVQFNIFFYDQRCVFFNIIFRSVSLPCSHTYIPLCLSLKVLLFLFHIQVYNLSGVDSCVQYQVGGVSRFTLFHTSVSSSSTLHRKDHPMPTTLQCFLCATSSDHIEFCWFLRSLSASYWIY